MSNAIIVEPHDLGADHMTRHDTSTQEDMIIIIMMSNDIHFQPHDLGAAMSWYSLSSNHAMTYIHDDHHHMSNNDILAI